MRYARARRLTEAARALARDAPTIVAVALATGYASHEAFTRAFRDQFGVTPETVRHLGSCADRNLMEPIRMSDIPTTTLETPRREHGRALILAGERARYDSASIAGIPAQWRNFRPMIASFPDRVGGAAYGVCHGFDEEGRYDYLTGVEVARTDGLPSGVSVLRIPARDYLVFRHRGHVSEIGATWRAIMDATPPPSGPPPDAPCFERYAEDFDGDTGTGAVEIWIPAGP
jgi:AraC family transcriptional regulator